MFVYLNAIWIDIRRWSMEGQNIAKRHFELIEQLNRLVQEIDERWSALKQSLPQIAKAIQDHDEMIRALEKTVG